MPRETRVVPGQFRVSQLQPFFALLRNPDRLVILWKLSKHEGPTSIAELQSELGLTVSSTDGAAQAIRRHLGALAEAGLVDISMLPNYTALYSFNRVKLQKIVARIITTFGLFAFEDKEAGDEQ